jgi:hypothetical protein
MCAVGQRRRGVIAPSTTEQEEERSDLDGVRQEVARVDRRSVHSNLCQQQTLADA